MCFFFQAEDGIRDIGVTGVQTCALPICAILLSMSVLYGDAGIRHRLEDSEAKVPVTDRANVERFEIGRASCRERVQISAVAGSLKQKKIPRNCPRYSARARLSSPIHLIH